MTIDEARSALLALESGDESYQESFGPRQWVLNHRGLNDADKAWSHDVARTLIFAGSPEERRYALDFWAAVRPPAGASDALGELYLSESPADPNLRKNLGRYTGHTFSPDVGKRLAARFAADPKGEGDLAGAAVKADPDGPGWAAFAGLVKVANDKVSLYALYDVAYRAERVDAFCALLKGKPRGLLEEVGNAIAMANMAQKFRQLTGLVA